MDMYSHRHRYPHAISSLGCLQLTSSIGVILRPETPEVSLYCSVDVFELLPYTSFNFWWRSLAVALAKGLHVEYRSKETVDWDAQGKRSLLPVSRTTEQAQC